MVNANLDLIRNFHFVVSSPRSGSTWLANALNGHPDLLATENRLFGMFCEIWKNKNGKYAPRITFDQFARGFARHSFFEALGFESAAEMETSFRHGFLQFLTRFLTETSGKPVVIDKVTPYLGTATQVVPMIRQHFEARVVHLIRDGRDVAVSGVFDWIAREKEESDRFRLFVQHDRSVKLQRFFDDELLERWTQYWSQPIQALADEIGILEVRYESMLEDQSQELNAIFQFLGLESSDSITTHCVKCASFEQLTGRSAGEAQPLAKQRKGIAGDWKQYFTRHDARKFSELTGDLLIQLGYERDHSWVESRPESLSLDYSTLA